MQSTYRGRQRALVSALLLALPLVAISAEDVEVMAEVQVKAGNFEGEIPSEQTESYTIRDTATATRLNTSIKGLCAK